MSNTQAKSIALSALNFATVAIVFSAKAFLYLCIALYVAGELMFAEHAQSAPSTQPIAPRDPDIAEDIAEAIAPAVCTLAKAIARPGAVLSIPTEAIAKTNPYATLTAGQLRKKCTAIGIKWRNVYGSKHLSKAEMFKALAV